MLPKTYKLQLSALLSEHIGPGTCDGCQLKAQHLCSSGKMEPDIQVTMANDLHHSLQHAVKATSNCVPSLGKKQLHGTGFAYDRVLPHRKDMLIPAGRGEKGA